MRSKVTAGSSYAKRATIYDDVSADWCEWACSGAEREFFVNAKRGVFAADADNLRTCAMVLAANHGHLDTLRCWKREKPYRLDEPQICEGAAAGGHLEVLKWLRENECPWNYTCRDAALGGHLEVLKWARENGCPWNERKCTIAAEKVIWRC